MRNGYLFCLRWSNIYGLACTQGCAYAERGARRGGEINERDGRWKGFQHDFADGARFIRLSLVLLSRLRHLFAPVAIHGGAAKIVQHETLAFRENLHALFRQSLIAFREISDRAV